jgi:hypothetical protein
MNSDNKIQQMEDVDCPTCGIQAKKQLIYKKDDGVGFY